MCIRDRTNDAHRTLVRDYLMAAGFDGVSDEHVPTPDDPLWVVQGRSPAGGTRTTRRPGEAAGR